MNAPADEPAVRELKKQFPISDWLARRLIKLYKGNVGTAKHRVISEDLGRLEEQERRLAKEFGEDESLFEECGKRDGRDQARTDIEKGKPSWMSPGAAKVSRSLCVKCHKVTTEERSFLKKLMPRCCLSAHRIPIRSAGKSVPAEARGFCAGYNGTVSRHVKETLHPRFDPQKIR